MCPVTQETLPGVMCTMITSPLISKSASGRSGKVILSIGGVCPPLLTIREVALSRHINHGFHVLSADLCS